MEGIKINMNNFEKSEREQDKKYEEDLNYKLNHLLAKYATLRKDEFSKERDYWVAKRKILEKILEIYTEIKTEGFDLNYEDYTKRKEDIKRITFYINYEDEEVEKNAIKRDEGEER